jgi:peroxiredoxin
VFVLRTQASRLDKERQNMSINMDLDTQLAANLVAISQQAVANTQNFAHYANLAFTRDLLQSGQSSTAGLLAALSAADRTPNIKTTTGSSTTTTS